MKSREDMAIEMIPERHSEEDLYQPKYTDPLTPEHEPDNFRRLKDGSPLGVPEFPRRANRGTSIVIPGGIPGIEPIIHNKFMGSNNSLREITDNLDGESHSRSVSRLSSTNSKLKKKLSEMSESKGRDMSQLEANFTKFSQRQISVSPIKTGRLTGYRTLAYVDLLSMNSNNTSKDQHSQSPKNESGDKRTQNNLAAESTLQVGKRNSCGGSHRSILVVGDNEHFDQFSKNDYSALDFSVNLANPPPVSSKRRHERDRGNSLGRRKGMMGSRKATSVSNMIVNQEASQNHNSKDDDEQRQNKDLNTTYVYKTEVMGPKKISRDHGISVSGKVTQINQYILVTVIGKGGWGEVYFAIHSKTQQKFVTSVH